MFFFSCRVEAKLARDISTRGAIVKRLKLNVYFLGEVFGYVDEYDYCS